MLTPGAKLTCFPRALHSAPSTSPYRCASSRFHVADKAVSAGRYVQASLVHSADFHPYGSPSNLTPWGPSEYCKSGIPSRGTPPLENMVLPCNIPIFSSSVICDKRLSICLSCDAVLLRVRQEVNKIRINKLYGDIFFIIVYVSILSAG